jgi:hypothetical protein
LPPCPFSDRLLVKVKWFTKCKVVGPKKKEVEKIRSLEVKKIEDRRLEFFQDHFKFISHPFEFIRDRPKFIAHISKFIKDR